MGNLILTFIITFLIFLSGISDARLGNAAFEEGNYTKADSLYRLAIEENPDDPKLYFNLGNALAMQDKVEEAIEAYMTSESLSIDPADKAFTQYNIGTLLAKGEKWKPAALHFKNSLKLNPADVEAKHNYELAKSKASEENEEDQENQDDQNQPPPKPSEYAKAMKKQAEKLVAEKQYRQASDLMNEALSVDETVKAFNDFIQRIETIDQIDS